jgi:hypothetical protein
MSGILENPARRTWLWAWLLLGFVAGFISVLTFHQGTSGILFLLGWGNNLPYPMEPIPPLNVPQFVSLAFWGGVWLTVFALLATRLPALARKDYRFLVAGFLFGALVISPFNWFVLAPLRGQPLGNGFVPVNMLRGIFLNGVFGLGGAVWMLILPRLLSRRSSDPA